MSEPTPAPLRARLAAFLLLAALLELGPVVRQALAVKTNALRGWQMFHKKGAGICDVRYRVQEPDGTARPLPSAEVARALGKENRDHFGSPYRIVTADDADNLGAAYCKKLPAGSALHAVVRCGDADRGWVAQRDGQADLCVRRPDKPPRPGKAAAPSGRPGEED